MKSILIALITLTALASQAAVIRSARLDASKKNILIDVTYGGGCKTHAFELKMGICYETYPVRCQAQLVDLTNDDFCEALISTTVVINLKEAGLEDRYYSNGSLTITGADDGGGTASSASIRLPERN